MNAISIVYIISDTGYAGNFVNGFNDRFKRRIDKFDDY